MIDIRYVKERDCKGHSICQSTVLIPVDEIARMNPAQVGEHTERQVQLYAEGAACEIEAEEGCGPVQYAEVECVGLCYVYIVDVHGQTTPAMAEAMAEEVTHG